MTELFTLDKQNYDPSWPVFKRDSARGIIVRDGKVLMIYSAKYKYYKFPGGGIREGEAPEEALQREVLEESGRTVIPESIREYGYVPRRQKDARVDGIFEQNNYYYLCDVTDDVAPQKLDDYEEDEGFTTVWIDPMEANAFNRHTSRDEYDPVMLKRENKVLDMLDLYLRRERHKADELAWKNSLGEPYYADMLDFVGGVLGEYSGWAEAKLSIRYSRFEHTKRVLGWALRLYNENPARDSLDYNAIVIATIFHDVGYNTPEAKEISHAAASANITRKYLADHAFDPDLIDRVCYMVGKHSDKWMMAEPDISPELLVLMEADLLDDMGALGVVMDCMIERAWDNHATFEDVFNHIGRYTLRQQLNNPMRTPEGRAMWDRKTKLVEDFYTALEGDIMPWK